MRVLALFIAALVFAAPKPSFADVSANATRQAQNPLARAISVPLENNFNFDAGIENGMQYVLNLQPVIPFQLTEDWNLITRPIVPIIYQPLLAPGVGKRGGLGDAQISFFLSPGHSGSIVWGIGPIISFPTATDDVLGSGKLSIGPTAAILAFEGRWVLGILVNQLFSVAGKSDRAAVSRMLIQPFIYYNLPDAWYLTSSPIFTADWKADSDRWAIPVGGGVGKIFLIGKAPINTSLQGFYYVKRPELAARWSLRFTIQFMFPE